MYLKSKYNHKGFHKSKIQSTSYYQQSDTIDANTNISKSGSLPAGQMFLMSILTCLILMPNYI